MFLFIPDSGYMSALMLRQMPSTTPPQVYNPYILLISTVGYSMNLTYNSSLE